MELFDVYPLFDITPVRAEGSWLWDERGDKYLDFYGGHAVISVGHSHPHYVQRLTDQLRRIAFYSNSIRNNIQVEFARKLGEISGYPDYRLFLCNSGAEANENALKIASFITGRKKVVAFKRAFHGRTSGAVAATDNPKIVAPFNANHEIIFVPLNDRAAFDTAMTNEVAAVIIEGIQGVGGIQIPEDDFLEHVARNCQSSGSLLIVDEIQSGYGRTGKFFAHQYANVRPHLITTAKGMGNGFPIGGVLIHPDIKPWSGMLGTTFGGNYLASVAGLAVLEIIEREGLLDNARMMGDHLKNALSSMSSLVQVRGRGLMIGLDLPERLAHVRNDLLFKHKIFVGEAKPNTIRLLPSLAVTRAECDVFISALKMEIE